MFTLKSLSQDAIPAALEKAMRYRLLNEPGEAESICLDVLQADPGNQQALVLLFLALTDRFGKGYAISETTVKDVLLQIQGDYEKTYYNGIHWERKAKAILAQGGPGSGFTAFEWLETAMDWYEKAEALRPPGNDDPLLRWNTCARIITRNHLAPRPKEESEPQLE